MKVISILATAFFATMAAAAPLSDAEFSQEMAARALLTPSEDNANVEKRGSCGSGQFCSGGRCKAIVCQSTGIGTSCTTFTYGKC